CRALLGRLLEEYPRYANLGVIDVEGKVACSAVPANKVASFSGQSWFERSVETGDFAMGTGEIGPGTTDPTLIISYPVKDEGDNVQRVAFAAVDLTHFNQLMSHVQVPRSTQFTLLSHRGTVLSCFPDPENCLGKSLAETTVAEVVLSRGMGTAEIKDAEGSLRLYAFAPLSSSVDTGLYVIISLPVAMVYDPATRILLSHFAGVWLVIVVALSIVWYGSTIFILNPVNILVRTTQRLSGGDMEARAGLAHRHGELGRLGRAFDEMAAALENQTLQLRSLASQVSLAEERERRRIAIDLHDRVGQALAISNIKLGMLRQLESSTEFSGLVDEISNFLEQAIQETRTLMFEISSPILYELGFEAAIKHLTKQIENRHGIAIICEHDQRPQPLEDDLRVLLFQAVNELLVNVVKHARARQVIVHISRADGQIRVSVKDDGVGFDASGNAMQPALTGGFGLFSIRERLNHIGGGFFIESQYGQGTLVTLVAPQQSCP
ncbi:MAG: HAMP domain-containing protein, partial [Methanoregulaceae archaeon]|nr:HAMP domain-containing protein [Methanoregulaceae archaeon]